MICGVPLTQVKTAELVRLPAFGKAFFSDSREATYDDDDITLFFRNLLFL
jgi:hypothetical protein